jgi:regulator of replication initiation timing
VTELGSITALINAAGAVIGLASKTNTAEANQKILELQKRMGEVNQTLAELFQENQTLKEEKRQLQDEINAETMYPLRESVRWKKGPDGEADDGPFCPTCFANGRKLMPLHFRSRMQKPNVFSFACPEHGVVPAGTGRAPMYEIKESSLKPGRYYIPD